VSRSTDVVSYEIPRWGVGELVLDGGRPVLHASPVRGLHPQRRHLAAAACDPDGDAAESLVASIGRFFAGEPVAWTAGDIGLDESLDEWGATTFQRALAHELVATPYGEIVGYGELAERAGYPRAARAAGTFCAHNPLALFLPCHRVVRGDGSPGSYGSLGERYKRRLLLLERRTVAA
jgi:methylated-DNA-[protein]-cysteine S-methyltransferase